MRLTSFTDFGLRMLMRMAADPSRANSTAELAEALGLSRNHLAKIIQHLARAGLIETRRGGGGGAVLARPASEIRLGQVIGCWKKGSPWSSVRGRWGCLFDRHALSAQGASAFCGSSFLTDLDRSTLADIALPPLVVSQ